MNNFDQPDSKSVNIDLSLSLDGLSVEKQAAEKPELHRPTPSVGVKFSPTASLINEGPDEEFGIPKFLLKNNSNDAAAYEEDKFVNRSMKMVQDACKTLTDDAPTASNDLGGPDGFDFETSLAGADINLQSANHSNWKIPTTFAILAIGVGVFIAYQQGNLLNISLLPDDLTTPPTLIASGYGEKRDGAKSVSVNGWGALAGEKRLVGQDINSTTSEKAVKLDNRQYESLKVRLGNDNEENITTPSAKRQQIAALVAEQAPEPAKKKSSLTQINRDALALEADVTKSEPEILTPNPVIVAPVEPIVKLAQNSSGDETLKLLTNNVVAQLTKLKKFEENPSASEIPETQDLRNSINQLVQQATSENLDSNAIEGLLQEALENSNAVPKALARADGKLDTRLLLLSVLSQVDGSQVKSEDSNYLSALDDEGSSTVIRTSLVSPDPSDKIEDRRIKTVDGKKTIQIEVGDTLSKISFSVYGDALAYTRIYKANRKILKNPNILTVGTILLLP